MNGYQNYSVDKCLSIRNPSGEHTTRTIRIPVEWDEELNAEAEKNGVSVNSIFNELVEDYLLVKRFLKNYPHITTACSSLEELLNEIDDDKIYEIGKKMGNRIPRNTLLMRGLLPDYENAIWLIEKVYQTSDFLKLHKNETETEHSLFMRHNMGEKWSYYLKGYFEGFFRNLIDIDVEPEILDNSILINLPKKS